MADNGIQDKSSSLFGTLNSVVPVAVARLNEKRVMGTKNSVFFIIVGNCLMEFMSQSQVACRNKIPLFYMSKKYCDMLWNCFYIVFLSVNFA